MGTRTQVSFEYRAGRNNTLDDLLGELTFDQTFDTLDNALTYEVTLDPLEAGHVVPFGDITQLRVLGVISQLGLTIAPTGGVATAAFSQGAGGTYPTGFAGGETLLLTVDGITVTVTFLVADQSLDQVVDRINAAAALAGLRTAGQPAILATLNGGQLLLTSPTTGAASTLVVASGTGDVTLGVAVASSAGVEATAGQSPLNIQSPSIDGDISPFALVSLAAPGLTLTNQHATSTNRVTLLLIGDVLSEVPGDC